MGRMVAERLVGVELGVVGALGDEFPGQQVGVALELGARERQVALGGGQVRARRGGVEVGVLRVQARQYLALFHLRAQVGAPAQDLAGDAKGHVGLVARLDLAGEGGDRLRVDRLHAGGAHRAYLVDRRGFLAAGGKDGGSGKQAGEGCRLHGDTPLGRVRPGRPTGACDATGSAAGV